MLLPASEHKTASGPNKRGGGLERGWGSTPCTSLQFRGPSPLYFAPSSSKVRIFRSPRTILVSSPPRNPKLETLLPQQPPIPRPHLHLLRPLIVEGEDLVFEPKEDTPSLEPKAGESPPTPAPPSEDAPMWRLVKDSVDAHPQTLHQGKVAS